MARRLWYLMTAALLIGLAGVTHATGDSKSVQTMMKNASGGNVGVATLTDTPHGVLIEIDFAGMPPGIHAMHIHETGKCDPPFTSAGGHLNPEGKKHGFENPEGYHAGDLPNVVIAADGSAKIQIFAAHTHLRSGPTQLFDADGSALVVHAAADDHKSDPAGGAGDRIACGVLKPLEGVTVEDVEISP